MRAHHHFLEWFDPTPLIPRDPAFLPSEVQVHPPARHFLRGLLERPGQRRGGLLIGHAQGDTLHIHLATRLGHPLGHEVLTPDRGYALGLSDLLHTLAHPQWDWCGNWLSHPHAQLGGLDEDLPWVHQSAQRGLCNRQQPLVVVGWNLGTLEGRAYLPDPDAGLTLEGLRGQLLPVQMP